MTGAAMLMDNTATLAAERTLPTRPATDAMVSLRIDALYYSDFLAVRDVRFDVARRQVTALIGPSGCGKSSVLRCINRLNDLIPGFRFEGRIECAGHNIYAPTIDPVAVRRHVGMVFQQPNPFVKSIYDNVAFGLRINGCRGKIADRVEQALRQAALWDEVKDKLRTSALALSGGQQQRLCIARAIATEPDVLLMDEPCSALDPIATRRIEDLIHQLKQRYTIVIVTHNLHQAARVADFTAFFYVDVQSGRRTGYLVEFEPTKTLFAYPRDEHTKAYLMGHFG